MPALLVIFSPAFLWAAFTVKYNGYAAVVPTPGITLGNMNQVALDGAGNLFITDTDNNQIVEVSAAGVASVVTVTTSPALSSPRGVAVDSANNLYISDTGNARIVKLASGTATVVSLGAVTLVAPRGLAIDGAGNLFIADTGNNRIVKLTSAGSAAAYAITGLGTALAAPNGLTTDQAGNLFIADTGNSRIVKVTTAAAGSVVNTSGLGSLSGPKGIAVDGSGNMFISDTGNGRVGEVLATGGTFDLDTGSITIGSPVGIAVDPFGQIHIADTGNLQIVTSMPTAANLGHVQYGAVSGSTLTLPFSIGILSTLGSTQGFTMGTSGLDFTVAPGTTCVNGVTSAPCVVNLQFSPVAPGLRRGALVFYDQSHVVLFTLPVYGFADAPLAALSPNTATKINVGSAALNLPFQIALNGAGDLYVANYNGSNVLLVPAAGGSGAALNTGGLTLQFVAGVALDGAGNLFISDHVNSRIVTVTPAGQASVLAISGISPGLNEPTGLAVDAVGSLYISDWQNARIVKVYGMSLGSSSSGTGAVLTSGSFTYGASSVTGVAVDGAGTIYAADRTNNRVVKVTANGAASLVVAAGVTAFSNPQGVGTDAMGNVYVVDSGNNRIVQITTAATASVIQTPGLAAPASLSAPFGVTIDPFGNIIIPDWTNNRLVKADVSAAVLSYPNTNVGQSSAASTAAITNIGDQTLSFASDPVYPANFPQSSAGTSQCLTASPLLAGQVCNISPVFSPQSAGSLTANIIATDNNGNVTNATQQVSVSGTGISVGDTTSTAVTTTPLTTANIGQPISVTALVTDTQSGHSSTIPTGTVSFTDTVGSTVTSLNGGSPVTLTAGTATLTGVILGTAGVHTITASFAGVSGTFIASNNTTTLTLAKTPVVVATSASQPVQVTNGQAGSIPITVTGPYSSFAVPTGTISYNLLNSSQASVDSGTLPLTAGTGNATATVPLASTLATGSYTVSVSYVGNANYAVSSTPTTILVSVGLVPSTVAWTQPSGAITYGTSLASLLNATAANGSLTIPGSFAYTATPTGGTLTAVTGATVLGAGTYTLTATFTPTDTTSYAAAIGHITLTVGKATPAITLEPSVNPVLLKNSLDLTATVASSASLPAGSIIFYDGTTQLGAVTLAQGTATFTITTLAVGTHSITAVYSGNANFSTRTSSAIAEKVNDFSLNVATSSTTSATVKPGGAAIYSLLVSPSAGTTFPAIVTLTLSGLPAGATGTVTPRTLPAGAGPTTITLNIQTAIEAALRQRNLLAWKFGPAMLGIFLLPFAKLRRIGAGKKRFLLLLFVGTLFPGLTACGGKSSGVFGHQQQTYNVVVTATSGNLSHSTTVALTVQ
ncbi:MAG TPA: Ig-like domain repeat protein [Terriglobales bacterium]|nr:Ig-like domain repeat protein [Terriglobales bacterium]